MTSTSSLRTGLPLTDIYESPKLIRKKPSSSSFSDSEDNSTPEEVQESDLFEAKVYGPKPTTPTRSSFINTSYNQSNTLLTSPTIKRTTLSSPQQHSSMVRQQSANIHSIFNKLNTLNEKSKHDDKRSFLHSIKGHMRKNSKDKFASLFDPFEGSPLNDTWRGSPLQPFSADDVHRSPTPSPHSPMKSPTLTSYPTFAKLNSHSKRRFTYDNTVEEIAREMEQYYVQNNQRMESYIDQITVLEKQKRSAVIESKQWKKKSIYAENKLHNQEIEFQDEIRSLSEQHQNDLEMIKGIHRKKCKQYGEIIKKLMATNEAFRAQLQEHGIVPVTANPEAEILVETQEWAEDREFIQKKLAAIEQRKLSSGPEEEMAASIEYITLALGVELRQNQVKKYQDLPEAASQPDPPSSSPLVKPEKLIRQRSSPRALHEKRPDNYFSLRIGKERKKDIEKVTSIYHKTDHRRLKNNNTSPTVLPHYQSDKYSLSDDSSSSDEESMPLSYITTTRGPLDRRMKPNLQPKRVVPMPTVDQVKPVNVEPTFQFKATDDVLLPMGQRLREKEENRNSTSNVDVDENRVNDISLNPDIHTHMDDISSNLLSRTEDKPSHSHDSNVHEADSNTSQPVSNARTIAFNLTPRVSPSLSVFAKNRNPIRSGSPSQRAANRLSTHNYPLSGVHMSPTPEFPTQAQRKKPLPKIPEIKSSTVVTSNIDLNEETL